MIVINSENIGLIKVCKNEILENIAAVYHMGELIWGGSGARACFSSGMWIDTLPWLDDATWKD